MSNPKRPNDEPITEAVYSQLFKAVSQNEGGIQRYFSARASHLSTSPVLAFDSTTISTYSENQPEARQGFNKDGDGLHTIKLLTLYSVKSREPMAFAKSLCLQGFLNKPILLHHPVKRY